MTCEELCRLTTTHLDQDGGEPWSQKPGAVLYSDLASIRPGRFYLMGINPGGHGGKPIRETLCAPDGTNSYADECWACPSSPCEHLDPITGRLRPEARKPMQKRVCDLIEMLGVEPRDMPSINLVFARSPSFAELSDRGEWFRRCWPVHQALLRVVRPNWIITLGFGEAYNLLRTRGTTIGKQEPIGPGSRTAWHQPMALDIGEGSALNIRVLAVAHPSTPGFSRYPEELRTYIANEVLSGNPR